MEDYQYILQQVPPIPLFHGITQLDLQTMLTCLGAIRYDFAKDSPILKDNATSTTVGILLKGKLYVKTHDYFGNTNIIAELNPGEVFGEAFACSIASHTIDVDAALASTVLFLNGSRIINVCPNACCFHHQLVRNLLHILADHNIKLNRKVEILSKRTTRSKILTYLTWESQKCSSSSFTISFNRQQLADYLAVERSALSAELSRLRSEKILDFSKSTFTLKQPMQ